MFVCLFERERERERERGKEGEREGEGENVAGRGWGMGGDEKSMPTFFQTLGHSTRPDHYRIGTVFSFITV